jgi:hypothetical protein
VTCVSGKIAVGDDGEVLLLVVLPEEERGEILLLPLLLLFWDVDVVVVVADGVVVGVREERLRAALIRTFTVDGIFYY